MPLTEKQFEEINGAGQLFLEKRRPPQEIRNKLDIAYRIEGQSVIIYEIRPRWDNPNELIEGFVAKTTFVKNHNHWKVFWMRADLKWHIYTPQPALKSIKAFFQLVVEDKHACFWG
jgi:hypothetical protein